MTNRDSNGPWRASVVAVVLLAIVITAAVVILVIVVWPSGEVRLRPAVQRLIWP